MAEYRFVTVWRIVAPRERVWRALNEFERYGEWWPCFVGYRNLTPQAAGVGSRAERAVRGHLPYVLRYTTTVTKMEPPSELAYDASGDLTGSGRFLLEPRGGETEVVFHWNVRTSGFWLNLLAPLLRWLFAWNHQAVMAQGERGLNEWLKKANGDSGSGSPSS